LTQVGSGAKRFEIRLGPRSRPLLLLWGVRERNAFVDVGADLDAHFGFFRLRTPITNVARWRVEGPWRWVTAIGVRRGIRDGAITFAGNHIAGVRLDFRERVRWGPLHVPRLYVTVADPQEFCAELTARGIPGEDARRVS
jgi:hypothetical protein